LITVVLAAPDVEILVVAGQQIGVEKPRTVRGTRLRSSRLPV
jgi:hypothetical protein